MDVLWNATFPGLESIASIAVGSWDKDDIPDLMVKYNYGSGFPVYEYEQTMVLSGKDGKVISTIPIDSITSQSSPLAISIEVIQSCSRALASVLPLNGPNSITSSPNSYPGIGQ